MKGIILAGGSGTRLYPLTLVTSKQLLPIHDKPMIYYPLSALMLAGINEILIISNPHEIGNYERLLGNGKQFGISLSYRVQEKPEGISQALLIGESFIGNDSVALILGDNIIYGNYLTNLLKKASKATKKGATIFGYFVPDPERFGVVEFNSVGDAISIEEKPTKPKSNYAIIGLYFFDKQAAAFANNVKPSPRGELEITDVLNQYLDQQTLTVELLGRGFAWLDTGTIKTYSQANEFIRIVEERQNIKIACLEEIAFHNGWITATELKEAIKKHGKSEYGQHLANVLEGKLVDLQKVADAKPR